MSNPTDTDYNILVKNISCIFNYNQWRNQEEFRGCDPSRNQKGIS